LLISRLSFVGLSVIIVLVRIFCLVVDSVLLFVYFFLMVVRKLSDYWLNFGIMLCSVWSVSVFIVKLYFMLFVLWL